MILKVRNSKLTKVISLTMTVIFMSTLNPLGTLALTGGPAQPEFNSFTPIGTSDMVDLASGDFSYNIPLMDVGGFPINIAYSSGVNMDQEASWVGLGWDLSIGQINRQMRGLPDDFNGEVMHYENNIKDNYTVGTSFTATPDLWGFETKKLVEKIPGVDLKLGLSAQYNSYNGLSMNPSLGISYDLAKMASVGMNISSGPNGLTVSPNVSLRASQKSKKNRDAQVGANFGLSFNSRQGLSNLNMSASLSTVMDQAMSKLRNSQKGSLGSSISFVNNTYTPSVKNAMTSANFTFNAGPGFTLFGVGAQGELSAFGSTQFMLPSEKNKEELGYGYNYTHNASELDVLDFNREKDGNFSVNSTNLPITNYTYDIYSVQGQGVGGMFRPYRSQTGYVYDNESNNFGGGGSLGLEAGTGNLFDVGIDIKVNRTSGKSGVWDESNNAINTFDSDENANPKYEEVYYKNVGDLSVDDEPEILGDETSGLGGYYPARLKLTGGEYNRELANNYEIKDASSPNTFNETGELIEGNLKRDRRVRRNQTIQEISYSTAKTAADNGAALLGFNLNTGLGIDGGQTAGFIVTRNDGARYVYGEALYNTNKREVTFALGKEVGGGYGAEVNADASTGLVGYVADVDNTVNNGKGDHYFNRVTTPAYAHSYLLTTLLSTDYSDVDDIEGPSVNDFGSYTTFEYRNEGNYNWRVPFLKDQANYNEGLKTDPTDDKGSYVYGQKQLSYIKKIETKTHVALFYISPRKDGHGVVDENGGIDNGANMFKLDKIALYSRGEFYEKDEFDNDIIVGEGTDVNGNITTTAIPIKTVHFEYEYSLCRGIVNNSDNYSGGTLKDEVDRTAGKLTLTKVYFTYRNSNMGKYSAYEFRYADEDHDWPDADTDNVDDTDGRNPDYNLKGYDVWGNYKPNNGTAADEPIDPISAPAFNYVEQNGNNQDDYAAAWSLSDIKLPSGGTIKVDYEADDYQFVQDKKAMQMFKVTGAGPDIDPSAESYFNPSGTSNDEALLYKTGDGSEEAKFLYVELHEEHQSIPFGTTGEKDDAKTLFYQKYLRTIHVNQNDLVQFRFFLNTNHRGGKNGGSWQDNGNFDYVAGYFELDLGASYNVFKKDGKLYGSIPMKLVDKGDQDDDAGDDNYNPISKAGWYFGRKYLSKYVYGFPEPDATSGASATVNAILGSVNGLLDVFIGANGTLRTKEIARRFIPEKSWVRLSSPVDQKYGGGCRVQQLVMTDEWADMTGGAPSTGQKYGQEYSYVLADGSSSGVATYEPVGSKENPLIQPVFVTEKRVLAPDEENYMEKPFGESYFPSAKVTYSRVSVKNIERIKGGEVLTKHATGEVITEHFTTKDYPTIVDQTKMEVHEDKPGILGKILNIKEKKHLTLSQGYLVHLNDMNGKMKSQRVYAQGQEDYISGVDYHYDHFTSEDAGDPFSLVSHNPGKLNNEVSVLYPDGSVKVKTLGVEYDVVNDFREMTSKTTVGGINTNVNTFLVGAFPGIVPLPIPDFSMHEDKLDIASTTKIINTYGIQRETVAHDAGASVYTRNLLWDAHTGEVLLTETVNEYGDKYYSLNYPAHWYYQGMGLASENSGVLLEIEPSGSGFALDGAIPGLEKDHLNNGDEVLLSEFNLVAGIPDNYEFEQTAWVHSVTNTGFKLMDKSGSEITLTDDYARIKIIRSGQRNLQATSMGSVVLQKNPLDFLVGGKIPVDFLNSTDWDQFRIVNAGAVEFAENWLQQCECGVDNSDTDINPYVQNVKGVWRADKSWLYLTGRKNSNTDPNPRNDGFYNSFSPFYYVDGGGNWHIQDDNWTYTAEVTAYSPYGFELENADALNRYSAAQYGYNYSFPLSVGANSQYREMGYDGFEDYTFDGCGQNEHFGFRGPVDAGGSSVVDTESHTGRHSLKVAFNTSITKSYKLDCDSE